MAFAADLARTCHAGYRCSIWDSVSRLWTKERGVEMVDGAQCSLP